jgi:hypothetical protein
MSRNLLLVLLLATGVAMADEAPGAKPTDGATEAQAKKKEDEAKKPAPGAEAKAEEDPDLGMSILGNQEAPKSLVIVPWKSSELGKALGISTLLDDSRQPIDKDVFMRMLSYYDIRSTTTRQDGTPAGNGAARPAAATHRGR